MKMVISVKMRIRLHEARELEKREQLHDEPAMALFDGVGALVDRRF